ncbi:MAG TPA: stage II sporulation protein E [Firmicutes bacterium]|nr:stage II sporulation protein E [Bacillota bacterium]
MLNKARVDSPAFGQYEPVKTSWHQRLSSSWTSFLSDGVTLRLLIMAILLGRAVVFGDLAPFGLALFVAVRWVRPEQSWPAAIGLAVGALLRSPGAAVSLLGCMGIYVSLERYLLTQRWRNLYMGMAMASLTCLLVKLPVFLLQPPSVFDLTSTLLEAGLVTVLAYVFAQAGKSFLSQDRLELQGEQALAFSIVLAAMLIGLEGWTLFGIPCKSIAAAYFVMLGAHLGGPTWGCMAGATIGVVQNLAHPALLSQVGLYAGAGLLAGLFSEMKKIGVGLSFTLSLLLLTIYGSQPGDLRQLTYAALIAFGLLLFSGQRWRSWLRPQLGQAQTGRATSQQNVQRAQQLAVGRLSDLEAVFTQLAETFGEKENDEGFLVEKNFNALMDHIVTDVCENCSHFNDCWQKNFYKSYHTLLNMLALADAQGELSTSRVPEALKKRCRKPVELITCANYLVKVYKLNLYYQKKLRESRTLVANQLRGVANIMHSLTRDLRLENEQQHDLAEEIKEQIAALKLTVHQVEVYRRSDRIDVILNKTACKPDESLCVDQLIPLVSCLVGRPVVRMHSKCPGRSGKGKCTLCLSTSQPLRVESSVAQVCRTGTGVSGDTASIKELPNGKLAVLLSDGMGNGPEANRESRATVAVLEQLLRSGFDKKTAVQTINSVLMLRSSQETFATVDMAIIDLYTGIAELTKIGATAAFLKRGDKVECIRSNSLPAGILHSIDIESRRISLQPGDILVMLTDGLLDSQKDIADKEEWFARILRQSTQEKPADLVKYLMDRATMNTRNQVIDDMTVIAIRITKGAQDVPLVS